MKFLTTSLHIVLAAVHSVPTDAFVVPQESRTLDATDSISQQPLLNPLPNHRSRTNSILYQKSDDEEADEKRPGFRSKSPLDGVDEVAAEAEEALKAAEIALQKLDLTKNPGAADQLIDVDQVANDNEKETQKIISKLASGKLAAEDVTTKLIAKQNDIEEVKRREASAQEKKRRDAIALEARQKADSLKMDVFKSAFGATALGVITGAALDVYFMISDIDVGVAVPPLALGISLGAAAFVVGSKEDEAGQTVRNIFAGAVTSASDSVTSSVTNAVDSAVDNVKAIPDNIKTAVDDKVKETTKEIQQIPDRVKGAAIETAEGITGEIKQIPDRVKDAAIETADKTKSEIEIAAKKAVEEVKATPGRVAQGTKEAVVKTVEDVEGKIEKAVEDTVVSITGAVDEVVALPGKTLDDITGRVSNILPAEKEQVKAKQASTPPPPQMVPKPPRMPPPPSLLKELEKESVVKSPPNRKLEARPKLTKPKPKPTKAKVAPPPKKTNEEDNFTFSEVSLQNLVGGIKKEKSVEQESPVAKKKSNESSAAQKAQEAKRKQQILKEERKEAELASLIKKKQAAEARRNAAEEREISIAEKKNAQLAEAAEKRRLAEEKRAQAEEKKAALERQRLEAQEKKAEAALKKAKPGATISLGFFGFGQSKDKIDPPTTVSDAPKGVPTILNWVQGRDGAISGSISGSSSFRNGESITTSPITTKDPSSGSLVQTKSGSRYYLGSKKGSDNTSAKQIAEQNRSAAIEKQRQQAEERRNALEAKRLEAREKREAATATRKQAEKTLASSKGGTISLGKKAEAEKAEKVIAKAKPGATVSLGFFNFGQNQDQSRASTSSSASAPRGVPTLSSWKRNRDGSISGNISGSKAFRNGDSITTSPITIEKPTGGTVVTTISGSKYYLDATTSTPAKAGFFGASSTSKKTSAPNKSTAQALADDRRAKAENLRRQSEEKRAAAAEAAETKRRESEEKRMAQQEAAAARKREAEKKRQASLTAAAEAVATKKREAEERRQASIAVAAEKQAAAAVVAEARKREAEEKRQASITAAAEKRAAAARRQSQAKKSENAVADAKPRSTISLGFLNFGGSKNDSGTAIQTASVAPRGVPTISGWRQNRDKSITGLISGSKAYRNGESITTSAITGDAADNAVVQTTSGSKYFLAPKPSSRPAASKSNARAKKAEESVEKAKPGATISLGFFNFGSGEQSAANDGNASTPRTLAKAPRGVPSLSNWRQNRNGSLAGNISGSRAYADGESITTSLITSEPIDGTVVQTTSGSRYYLVPKSTKPPIKKAPAKPAAAGKSPAEVRKVQAAAAQARKKEADDKRAAIAETRRQKAEEKRAAIAAAAEARKQQAEEKRAAAAAAVEEKKQQAEEKRKATLAASEARKREVQEKKAAAAAAAKKRTRANKAKQLISSSKSNKTFSLGFLNFGQSKDDEAPPAPAKAGKSAPKIIKTPPRGVPTLSRWRQNRDGSITGAVSGSNAYGDGESITTSPIITDAAFSALVQTTSGSKYYLAPKGSKPPVASKPKPVAARKVAVKKTPVKKAPPKPKPKKRVPPPRGVPKLVNWRQNRNSSITGFISGSPNFDEGERITTSAITSGTAEAGQVVQTGSGSRYYLV